MTVAAPTLDPGTFRFQMQLRGGAPLVKKCTREQFHAMGDYGMFEGAQVAVRQQIFDKLPVLLLAFGDGTEGDPGGFHRPLVPAHEFHELNKTFVQYLVQD